MLRREKPRKVKALFAGYFKKQDLNNLVRNLTVQSPDIRVMPQIALRQSPILANLLLKLSKRLRLDYFSPEVYIAHYNLEQLNNKIAFDIKLEEALLSDWIKGFPKIEFENFDLKNVLSEQSELLQSLLEEQRLILRKEIDHIYQEELTKLKNNK